MPLLDNLASLAMAVVFSVYLARDTQMIVGGKHARFKFGPKDHVLAALSLYQDVISLFLRVLEILARLEEGQKRRYSSGPR
jgi:FtsH-binding integral membrane protein